MVEASTDPYRSVRPGLIDQVRASHRQISSVLIKRLQSFVVSAGPLRQNRRGTSLSTQRGQCLVY